MRAVAAREVEHASPGCEPRAERDDELARAARSTSPRRRTPSSVQPLGAAVVLLRSLIAARRAAPGACARSAAIPPSARACAA